jgi:hypothetical protein
MNQPVDTKLSLQVWGVRGVAVLLGIVFLAILAPFIWGAASAGAGLLVLLLLGILGTGVFSFLPFIGQKLENKILKLRKEEARKNPIEQLQNFLRQKSEQVRAFKNAVAQIGAQIRSLKDLIAERKRVKPGSDTSKQEQAIIAMEKAHAILTSKYVAAEKALVELQEVIEEKKFEWNFAQAGKMAADSLNATSGQQLLDSMLADEALSSVRDNFNTVFADLELEAHKLNDTKQLSFGEGMTLDLSPIRIPEFETQGR